MTIEEILELAARYVEPEEVGNVPDEGDIFYFQHRELPDNKIPDEEEGWQFGGYAQLLTYENDLTAKPVGKWIYMRYLSLATFPPQEGEIKLQPPHIALGKFQSPDRTFETRIVTLINNTPDTTEAEEEKEGQILQFKKK